ncbi:MAG: LysR family transcriptional regulator [Maritimibacter sp.]|nr:LysR family transcriptional regulator [Maritimibacter sp.]
MTDGIDTPHLRVRIILAPGAWMGRGKADLLDGIRQTGSIAAAGREMGMSYKRAWQLVETMNAMFREPLVVRTRGGANGGGATVTPAGEQVLAAYRGAVEAAHAAGAGAIEDLAGMLRDISNET